jgi:hypothetical protein
VKAKIPNCSIRIRIQHPYKEDISPQTQSRGSGGNFEIDFFCAYLGKWKLQIYKEKPKEREKEKPVEREKEKPIKRKRERHKEQNE